MISIDLALKGIRSAALAGHVRPDGDSVGACLAVYNYIRENYPEIRADAYLEPVPEKFLFLKNADAAIDPNTVKASERGAERVYDLFIALDCGDNERLGAAYPFFESARHTICIDHHITNQSFAKVNEVDPGASSTCELIYLAMDPEKISEAAAECLYVGISQDTGLFRYPCTSPLTMRIAGELISKGIPFPRIIDETYFIRTYTQQRIRGKAYADSALYLGGKCIFSVVTKEDMERYGSSPGDLDEVVSELRSTAGVEVSVLMYETDEGYKISLRSASYVDVAKIAREFGGGGHIRAAGATAGADAEEIRERLLGLIAGQI